MNETGILVLVLAAVYVWECLYWLRRGTVAFLTRGGSRWHLVHPAAVLGNQTGGLVLAHPLPPLGTFLPCGQSPLSVSADGIYSYVAHCLNPGWRPVQPARYFPFAAVKSIAVSGKEIRVNGASLVKTGSPYVAEHLAAHLRRLAGLPRDQRPAALKEFLTASLDVAAIRKRLDEFNGKSAVEAATDSPQPAPSTPSSPSLHDEGVGTTFREANVSSRETVSWRAWEATGPGRGASPIRQSQGPRTSTLRTAANILFIYLFLLAPYSMWRFGLSNVWLRLVIALLVLTSSLAVLFYRAHRKLYTDVNEDRLTHFCMILLSPATSIRALDALARPLLENFHPVAVARVLLQPAEFRNFARRVLLEIRHPCLPLCPTEEPEPRAVESEARAALQEAVENFLKQEKINVAELTAPPPPTDATCRSYCPRCNAQFTTTEGTCADCGGLALKGF